MKFNKSLFFRLEFVIVFIVLVLIFFVDLKRTHQKYWYNITDGLWISERVQYELDTDKPVALRGCKIILYFPYERPTSASIGFCNQKLDYELVRESEHSLTFTPINHPDPKLGNTYDTGNFSKPFKGRLIPIHGTSPEYSNNVFSYDLELWISENPDKPIATFKHHPQAVQ